MLVLSRRRKQVILIAPNIRVTVLNIQGDKVRIGVDAPDDVEILREELYERMQRNKQKEQRKCSES